MFVKSLLRTRTTTAEPAVDEVGTESGFGLIEIVVSMFILALLSLSFLPLLITALKASVTNATLATGTQLINQQLELANQTTTTTPTCAAVTAFVGVSLASIGTLTDRNGNVLQPHRQLITSAATNSAGCPLTYPGTVKVRIWVTKPGSTVDVVETTSLFYVKTAA